MTEQPQNSNVIDSPISPIKALMLDAQANLINADSQETLVSANDWQLNPDSVRQKLSDKGVAKAQFAQIQVLWVPTELVVLTQVAVPGKRMSDAQKALPFVLEASLALPIEEYFIAVLNRQKITHSETQAPAVHFQVALVAHEQMRLWQQAVNALGLSKTILLPDCFRLSFSGEPQKAVLPWRQDEVSDSSEEKQRLLLRVSEFEGFACPLGWGESIWKMKQPRHVATKNANDETSENIAGFENIGVVEDSQWLASDLHSLPAGEKLKLQTTNLLQGAYANHQQSSGLLKVSLISVMLIGFWLILMLADTVLQTKQLNEKTVVYQQQSEALFKQMFPDVKRVVNIKAQTISRLKSQAKAEKSVSLINGLSTVETLLAMTPDIQVVRLEWMGARKQLKLDLKAANSQQITRLSTIAKQRFAQFPISIVTKSVQPNLVEAQLYVR